MEDMDTTDDTNLTSLSTNSLNEIYFKSTSIVPPAQVKGDMDLLQHFKFSKYYKKYCINQSKKKKETLSSYLSDINCGKVDDDAQFGKSSLQACINRPPMETNIIMLPQEQLRGFKLGSMATSALSPEDKVKWIQEFEDVQVKKVKKKKSKKERKSKIGRMENGGYGNGASVVGVSGMGGSGMGVSGMGGSCVGGSGVGTGYGVNFGSNSGMNGLGMGGMNNGGLSMNNGLQTGINNGVTNGIINPPYVNNSNPVSNQNGLIPGNPGHDHAQQANNSNLETLKANTKPDRVSPLQAMMHQPLETNTNKETSPADATDQEVREVMPAVMAPGIQASINGRISMDGRNSTPLGDPMTTSLPDLNITPTNELDGKAGGKRKKKERREGEKKSKKKKKTDK